MNLPGMPKSRLSELPDDAGIDQIAALLLPWETGFLSDVAFATANPKKANAYQIGDDGMGGVLPFVVDFESGGGHMLSSEATHQFLRLKLVAFDRVPPCDGSCGMFDDGWWDDPWNTGLPSECTCVDLQLGIHLTDRGRALASDPADQQGGGE